MLTALLLALAAYFLVPALQPFLIGGARQNYRGISIPSSLGLAFVFPTVFALIVHFPSQRHAPLFAAALLVFTVLGLIDDFCGDSVKGFGGHFAPGGLSTGILKAVGGFAMSVALGAALAAVWWQIPLNALLMALSANFLNLLDLQPGRAGKAFLLLIFPLLAAGGSALRPALWLAGAVAGYLFWDLRESAMMGDAGSNALGAGLGLAAAAALPPAAKIAAAVGLVFLNLAAEKTSFSRVIEENRVLNFLDRLGR